MEYWHKIIEDYDTPNGEGSRGVDHGTLSQETSVALLIYLAFGADYPSSIAKYFIELLAFEHNGKIIPRVLTQPNKVSSVLKKMAENGLLILQKQVTVRAAPRSYYAINPQIIQSPSKGTTTYIKSDGSPLIISRGIIDGFLGWLALKEAGIIDKGRQKQFDEQLRRERHEQADEILVSILSSELINYFTFMLFIESKAREWDLQRGSTSLQPAFNKLISDYIYEFIEPIDPFSFPLEFSYPLELKRPPSAEAINSMKKIRKFLKPYKGLSHSTSTTLKETLK